MFRLIAHFLPSKGMSFKKKKKLLHQIVNLNKLSIDVNQVKRNPLNLSIFWFSKTLLSWKNTDKFLQEMSY